MLLTVTGVLSGVALGFILRASRDTPWTQREQIYVKFVGEIFLRMLKALILPLIVSSLVAAIGSLDLSLSGKIGARAISYYLVTTVCAVILGIVLVTTIRPGIGAKKQEFDDDGASSRPTTTADTLMDLIRYGFCMSLDGHKDFAINVV